MFELAPYLTLGERLGSFTAQIADGRLVRIKLTYSGDFGDTNSALIRNAALAGVLNRFLDEKANLINATGVAKDRGIGVGVTRRGRTGFSDTVTVLLETEAGGHEAVGAVFPDGSARLLSVDGIYVEAPLSGEVLFIKNEDVPGVIGKLGGILGDNGVNIADFSLGRRDNEAGEGPAEAVAVVRVDQPIPPAAISALEQMEAMRFARVVKL